MYIFTVSFDNARASQVHFVAYKDDDLLFGARLLPEVLEDLFGELETASVCDRVDEHKGVRVVRRQAILHLNKHRPAAGSRRQTTR